MLAAGEDVVVLDKFTYAGNPANLPEGDRLPPRRHRVARGRRPGRRASMRSSTSPPRPTSTVRSSARRTSCARTCSGRSCCSRPRSEQSARFVQVSTDEVYGDVEPGWSSREDDPLRPSSPYSASKAGGDLQVLAAVRTFGVNASITRGSNTYGPEPVSGEGAAALRRRTPSTASRCRSTATAARCATGCTSTTTARRSSSSFGRVKQARSTTSARARSTRTSSSRGSSSTTSARINALDAPRRGPRGPRPPLLARHDEDPLTRLATSARAGTTAFARRSTGTATIATGGSRSSAPAASASTTTGSTRRGSASARRRRRRRGGTTRLRCRFRT